MAAKRNPISEKAYEMYMQGMKLVDIAANLQVPLGLSEGGKVLITGMANVRHQKANVRIVKRGRKNRKQMMGRKRLFRTRSLPRNSSCSAYIMPGRLMQRRVI